MIRDTLTAVLVGMFLSFLLGLVYIQSVVSGGC